MKPQLKISILGAGSWGTALAIVFQQNLHDVTIWSRSKNEVKKINGTRINLKYLPKVKIPDQIKITSDLDEATRNKDVIFTVIPAQYLRSVLEKISFENIKNTIICNASKGIEIATLKTMSQVIRDCFPSIKIKKLAVLSGPSHAEEVCKQIPTTIVVASYSRKNSKLLAQSLSTPYFRIYVGDDVRGIELGGSLKNVIALAAGIIDGIGFGDNTKAALMTRGMSEISRLGIKLGALPRTFAGLSGMGDLIVTCMSKHSRNRFVGKEIGKGKKIKQILKNMNMVAEGVATSKSVYNLSKKYKIDMPISNEIYKILYEDKDCKQATYELMTRALKNEY
ncbi:MAG: NAD(P)H-dependent glycerol-3-phosphate dehydrogenase [Bacteroidetes bacterium]|nr:NAD(P)H-dependent glycerol-3-phosphate dehydrogenase [Bacteroidota bacterium]